MLLLYGILFCFIWMGYLIQLMGLITVGQYSLFALTNVLTAYGYYRMDDISEFIRELGGTTEAEENG